MKYNMKKLKDDIHADTKKLRELKNGIRQPGHMISAGEALDLMEGKKLATLRCAFAAHLHKRIHLRGKTAEEQAEFIKPVVEYYALPEDSTHTAA